MQASVTCAVIQCDFQSPQFPVLVASVPQIALIPRVEGKLAFPEEDIKVMCCQPEYVPLDESTDTQEAGI